MAKGLTGNQLKIIALVAMTVDHVGLALFPQAYWMRIVGRLAFPVFAYMIGEGCTHTRSPAKYLGNMAALALACQMVYYLVDRSVYQSVLVTFSLAAGLIFLTDHAKKRNTALWWSLAVLGLGAALCLTQVLPLMFKGSGYAVDYGFYGVVLPLFVYFGRDRRQKLALFALGLVLLSLAYGAEQWYCLLSVPLLMLYNGRRGVRKMKNLFYIYYPAHLVVIYAIGLIV